MLIETERPEKEPEVYDLAVSPGLPPVALGASAAALLSSHQIHRPLNRLNFARAQVDELEQLDQKYTVRGTKRGGMPVLEEKHKHNYVTMVKNVDGDSKTLLLELRNYIGAGGHLVPGPVALLHLQTVANCR